MHQGEFRCAADGIPKLVNTGLPQRLWHNTNNTLSMWKTGTTASRVHSKTSAVLLSQDTDSNIQYCATKLIETETNSQHQEAGQHECQRQVHAQGMEAEQTSNI